MLKMCSSQNTSGLDSPDRSTRSAMPSPEYHRYINSADWKESLRRKIALHLLFGQDVIFPVLKAHDVEHLSYRRIDFKRCKGYEIPVLDLLPLNRVTHRQVITPLKKMLRSCFGRKLGNAIVAYFLRGCLLFWYAIAASPILWFFN
jgi:hypothetical protein